MIAILTRAAKDIGSALFTRLPGTPEAHAKALLDAWRKRKLTQHLAFAMAEDCQVTLNGQNADPEDLAALPWQAHQGKERQVELQGHISCLTRSSARFKWMSRPDHEALGAPRQGEVNLMVNHQNQLTRIHVKVEEHLN
jgi:hypothetical protein